MYGGAQCSFRIRHELAPENALADANDGLRLLPDVLGERQNEVGGDWRDEYRGCGRLCLLGRQAQATVQLAEVVCRCALTHGLVTMAMQSTGQTGRHSSQPVHSAAMTVCM